MVNVSKDIEKAAPTLSLSAQFGFQPLAEWILDEHQWFCRWVLVSWLDNVLFYRRIPVVCEHVRRESLLSIERNQMFISKRRHASAYVCVHSPPLTQASGKDAFRHIWQSFEKLPKRISIANGDGRIYFLLILV